MSISEKEILAYFERAGAAPLKIRDLARALDVPRRDLPALRELVRRLEDAGRLHRGPNRRYQSSKGPDVVLGRLQGVRSGAAFIVREHGVREIKDAIARAVLQKFDDAAIEIASATYEIVALPPVRLTHGGT